MKIVISNYTFDASEKTIIFNDYTAITLGNIFLITNVHNDQNTIIYQFNKLGKGGTVTKNVLTLDYDTDAAGMDDTDELMILYEDPSIIGISGMDRFPNILTNSAFNFYDGDTSTFEDWTRIAGEGVTAEQTACDFATNYYLPNMMLNIYGSNPEVDDGLQRTLTGLLPNKKYYVRFKSYRNSEYQRTYLRTDGAATEMNELFSWDFDTVERSSYFITDALGSDVTLQIVIPAGETAIAKITQIIIAEKSIAEWSPHILDIFSNQETTLADILAGLSSVTAVVSGSVSISAIAAGTTNIGDVDVASLPSLPSGTNAIGKLVGNSGVDIGDVTINNASGANAVNIQDGGNTITVDGTVAVEAEGLKDLDAAIYVGGDGISKVIAIGGVDSGNKIYGITIDTEGHLQVDALSVASHNVTNAGTFAVQATLAAETTKVIGTVNIAASQTIAVTNVGTFAVQAAGDTAHDAADGTTHPVKIGGRANAEEYAAVAENDRANIGTDLKGNLRIVGNVLHDTADTGAPIKIGGKANAEEPAAVGENDRVNIGVDLKGNQRVVGNVAHDTADTGNPIKVGGKANAEEPAAVAENDRANIGVDLKGNQRTVGNVAFDTADTGNPIKVGAKCILFDGTVPPNVVGTEGDRTNAVSDQYGRIFVETIHPNYWSWPPAGTDSYFAAAQTNLSLKAAPGANLYLYITDIVISNGATAGYVDIINGSSAQGLGKSMFRAYLGINGGCSVNFKTPLKLAANTALCMTSNTVTTHSVVASGFTAP
jgi:hypothetical protein